ncbi:hypothetical protein J1902_01660 [Arthrobacter sp. PO-11]|uniref:Uncharacterized protein n=1 Tax=Arthrobacter cavernae TaxID=2817681 RepID=A0A939KIK0_9MICC|nr:hypothetical protein [Arthrobacter cavernae]
MSSAPRRLPPFATPLLVLAVAAAWIASVSIGSTITVDPLISRFAVIIHIMSLVLSFGAILLLDWVGFLWLTGRRRLHETSRLESAAGPLIWGGMAGLLASGALVHPDITSPITQLKLGAILALLLNGILLIPFMRRLHAMPQGTRFADLPRRIHVRLIACLTISQVSWWTAIVIGFINSAIRG